MSMIRRGSNPHERSFATLSVPMLEVLDDIAGIYNALYRYLYDWQRDLSLPPSFLFSGGGDIVKVDQGPVNPEHVEQDFRQIAQTPAERLAKALPFRGSARLWNFSVTISITDQFSFQRGYLDQAEASGFARRSIECRSPLWVRQRLPKTGEA